MLKAEGVGSRAGSGTQMGYVRDPERCQDGHGIMDGKMCNV
jgi:hypothetical protein